MEYCPPGSSVHGIFQARVLEWGAIAFSNRESNYKEMSHTAGGCARGCRKHGGIVGGSREALANRLKKDSKGKMLMAGLQRSNVMLLKLQTSVRVREIVLVGREENIHLQAPFSRCSMLTDQHYRLHVSVATK